MKRAQNKSNLSILADYLDGARPFTQVGYMPPQEEKHKDGDTWTDKDGKEWIQSGASKISKTLHETREATKQICSSCKKDIYWAGNRYDEKFFLKTGKCYDCVVEEETKMRIDGTFETYEKIKVIQNQKSFLQELKLKILESIDYLTNKSNKIEYIEEDGKTESWSDISRETFLTDAHKDLQEVNKSIILCTESLSMLDSQLNDIKNNAMKK